MQNLGKILWWDNRDKNGIIVGSDGRKYYFDSSVIETRSRSKIQSGLTVRFNVNLSIKDTLCAHNVAAANTKEQGKLQREIQNQSQLEFTALG